MSSVTTLLGPINVGLKEANIYIVDIKNRHHCLFVIIEGEIKGKLNKNLSSGFDALFFKTSFPLLHKIAFEKSCICKSKSIFFCIN